MSGSKSVSCALLALLVSLSGCCLLCDERLPAVPDREARLRWRQQPPGPGYVIGTADFDGAGWVIVKIQVEPLPLPSAEPQAEITVWGGNGDAPQTAQEAEQAKTFRLETGEVDLPYWTNHLDRQYDPGVDKYWIAVQIERARSGGLPPLVDLLFYQWTPSTEPPPLVRDFDYASP